MSGIFKYLNLAVILVVVVATFSLSTGAYSNPMLAWDVIGISRVSVIQGRETPTLQLSERLIRDTSIQDVTFDGNTVIYCNNSFVVKFELGKGTSALFASKCSAVQYDAINKKLFLLVLGKKIISTNLDGTDEKYWYNSKSDICSMAYDSSIRFLFFGVCSTKKMMKLDVSKNQTNVLIDATYPTAIFSDKGQVYYVDGKKNSLQRTTYTGENSTTLFSNQSEALGLIGVTQIEDYLYIMDYFDNRSLIFKLNPSNKSDLVTILFTTDVCTKQIISLSGTGEVTDKKYLLWLLLLLIPLVLIPVGAAFCVRKSFNMCSSSRQTNVPPQVYTRVSNSLDQPAVSTV